MSIRIGNFMIKVLLSKAYSYLNVVLLVLCIAMSVIIYSGYARITILNQKVSAAQQDLMESNGTIGVLREENAALHTQISDLLESDISTREDYGSIEGQWEDLVEATKKKPAKEVHDETNTKAADSDPDLSNHFRLLLESACKANNDCNNSP